MPIGEEDDLAFQMGTLLLEMDYYPQALEFFEHSIALYEMEPGTGYNMAVCYYNLGQKDRAIEMINLALELNPNFDAAKSIRIKIESGI